ncbi:MAG: hypothetical protein H6737_03010 [Alphaproteobacteria bacterium]|nr:hypothetical protein [Alphaproteobacteria bacterium]
MRGVFLVLPFCLLGCNPPSSGSRAVLELYMHPNGLSNCVDEHDGKWTADPSCCPAGFEVAGFSAPAATAYSKENKDGEEKENRRIFRHVVCLEIQQTPGAPPK